MIHKCIIRQQIRLNVSVEEIVSMIIQPHSQVGKRKHIFLVLYSYIFENNAWILSPVILIPWFKEEFLLQTSFAMHLKIKPLKLVY